MQINISTRHGAIADDTRAFIEKKVQKLPRLLDRVTAVDVTVDVEHRDTPLVEVRVSAEHAADFVATERGANLSSVFEAALHKIEQQLRKHKEKRDDRRASGVRHDAVADYVPEPE